MANFFKPTAKSKSVKDTITITIDKLDINGVGVARWNKRPLFIAGALPNETVKVKIIEQKNKYARAKILSIEKSGEDRIQPQCQHFGLCGGCDLQMQHLAGQIGFKQQKITELFSRSFSNAKVSQKFEVNDLPWQTPVKSEPWHYRRKARIGVQFDKNSQSIIGFRQKSTNQLAPIKSCPVLVEPLNGIFPRLKELLAQLTVTSAIGHIEVIQADVSEKHSIDCGYQYDQSILVVRQLKTMSNEDVKLWLSYAKQHQWHVIVDDGHEQKLLFSSVSTKNKHDCLALSYALTDSSRIFFDSRDFIQVNHLVNIAMVEQAITWLNLEPKDCVLDLFCGLGNFSLALAKHVQYVVGVEGVQVMVDKATKNAELNHLDNCDFFQADLNSDWLLEAWSSSNTYNKVLLDPARAGAEQAVVQVAKLKIPIVLYVSCDPATLARDSAILVAQGYKIEKISLMDMFTQTKHVETMVLFTL